MLDWTRSMPSVGTYAIGLLCQKLGVAIDPLLAQVGLPAFRRLTAETAVTGLQEVALLRALMTAVPHRKDLGLLNPGPNPLSYSGIFSYVFAGALDLEQALARNKRFMPLTWGMMDIHVAEDDADLIVTYEHGTLPQDVVAFYSQRNSRVLLDWTRGHGHTRGLQTHFSSPAPDDPEQLKFFTQFFGAEPVFEAPSDGIRIPLEIARQPVTTSTSGLPGLAEEAERQLAAYYAGDSVAAKIRTHLRNSLPADASLDAAAKSFFISPRTLRRQLADEDTSFRAVLDEVRAELAQTRLRSPNVQISQLAAALGYSSPPAFTAAFQRWFGCSPRDYHEQVRSSATSETSAEA